jgi:hypothetical protein
MMIAGCGVPLHDESELIGVLYCEKRACPIVKKLTGTDTLVLSQVAVTVPYCCPAWIRVRKLSLKDLPPWADGCGVESIVVP